MKVKMSKVGKHVSVRAVYTWPQRMQCVGVIQRVYSDKTLF